MKQAIALLLAGSAISLAGAAFAGAAPAGAHAFIFEGPAAGTDNRLLRVSGDDDEGEGEGEGWFWSGSDEGGSDDDDCEDDDEDEGGCAAGAAGNAAPAGSVAPPKNGLFTDGTTPQVKTN